MHRGRHEQVVWKYVICIRKLNTPDFWQDNPRTNFLKILGTIVLCELCNHVETRSSVTVRFPPTLGLWYSADLFLLRENCNLSCLWHFWNLVLTLRNFMLWPFFLIILLSAMGLQKLSQKKYFLPPTVKVILLNAIWIVLFLCLKIL